jgi:two-component system LytT family response regulator
MPAVVFVTAYDEYALKAFEVHAIDYLLKPFGRDRFAQTLQHAREHLERRRAGDLGKRLMALVQDIKPEPQRLDRLVVKSGGRVFFLRTQEIDWIEAAGNYVRLHLGEESHLFRETMNNMEGRLDTQRFVRIHRSRIVNTDRIKEMQPWFNGEYVVVLQNGTRLTLSRGYREKLQERLGQGF